MSIAASDTDIANLSIANLGSGKIIADLTTERSQEAAACRQFYANALQTALRAMDWGFNRQVVALTLVQDFRPKTYPNVWDFSYQYPANALIVRAIQSVYRVDIPETEIPFEKRLGQNGPLIFTDRHGAYAKIGVLVTAVSLMPPDFVLAFSMLLSSLIAPRLSSGDPLNLGAKAYQKYQLLMANAQQNEIVEGNMGVEQQSAMILARD